MSDDERLSALLFRARESLSMWADVVEVRTGQYDRHTRDIIAGIDEYRDERGWNPNGFGDENRSQ